MTVFVYDDAQGAGGRLVEKLYFASEGDYDNWVIDAAGYPPQEKVAYTYDAFGRGHIVDRGGDLSTPDDQEVSTYNELGQLITVASPEGVIHYEYDAVTGEHVRTWTADDEVTTENNAETRTVYAYDSLGRLDSVTLDRRDGAAVTPEMTDYVYDLLGNLRQERLPGGVVSDYTYDPLNRLDLLRQFEDGVDSQYENVYESDVDTLLAEYDYDLAADGRRTGVTEKTLVDAALEETRIDWLYDALGRLTREVYDRPGTADDYAADYVLDQAGNRRSKQTDADPTAQQLADYRTGEVMAAGNVDEAIAYAYDPNDRLLREQTDDLTTPDPDADSTTFYQYNATEQTVKTTYSDILAVPTGDPMSETIYTHNVQGRLSKVEIDSDADGNNDRVEDYTYNDSGIRVSKTVSVDADDNGDFTEPGDTNGEKTEYLIDANNPTGYAQILEETREEGGTDTVTTYTLGRDVIAQSNSTNGLLFLLYDGHGSTRGLVNSLGEPLSDQIFRYDAFGNRLDDSIAAISLLYSGEKTDLTGLQYLRARYYDPNVACFNRLDPFAGEMNDPLSLHKYLYAHANPVTGLDPSGQFFSLAGLSMASSIGTTMNQLTAMSGQSLATSLGVEMWADPLDLVLSRDIGILPKWVYDTIDSVGMFVMNHAGEMGVGATTFVLGAAFSRSKGSLGVRLKRYQDNIAGRIFQFGKSVIRRRMQKLEALGEDLIVRLKKGAMQVSGEFDEPMKGTDLNFVKRFLSDKRTNTRFWLYRPKAGAGLGDFVIIDMSDSAGGRAIALELKEKVHGFAGKQVTSDGHDILRKAGFAQIDLVTATESQFYDYIEYITKPLGAGSHIL